MYGNVSQYLAYKAIYEFDIFADASGSLESQGSVSGVNWPPSLMMRSEAIVIDG